MGSAPLAEVNFDSCSMPSKRNEGSFGFVVREKGIDLTLTHGVAANSLACCRAVNELVDVRRFLARTAYPSQIVGGISFS